MTHVHFLFHLNIMFQKAHFNFIFLILMMLCELLVIRINIHLASYFTFYEENLPVIIFFILKEIL